MHGFLAQRIDNQQARNRYLDGEIAKLDKQIDEIKKLKEQTASLLARKRVVESLQSNRTEAVRLLDQLVRQLPDGLYLKQVKQTGDIVNVHGLCDVERARVHPDAQLRGLAVARRPQAGRDQGGQGEQRQPERVQPERQGHQAEGRSRRPKKAGAAPAAGQAGVGAMTLDELRRLNPHDIGSWPVLPKLGVLLLLLLG